VSGVADWLFLIVCGGVECDGVNFSRIKCCVTVSTGERFNQLALHWSGRYQCEPHPMLCNSITVSNAEEKVNHWMRLRRTQGSSSISRCIVVVQSIYVWIYASAYWLCHNADGITYQMQCNSKRCQDRKMNERFPPLVDR
jgi:hypothetical protein